MILKSLKNLNLRRASPYSNTRSGEAARSATDMSVKNPESQIVFINKDLAKHRAHLLYDCYMMKKI